MLVAPPCGWFGEVRPEAMPSSSSAKESVSTAREVRSLSLDGPGGKRMLLLIQTYNYMHTSQQALYMKKKMGNLTDSDYSTSILWCDSQIICTADVSLNWKKCPHISEHVRINSDNKLRGIMILRRKYCMSPTIRTAVWQAVCQEVRKGLGRSNELWAVVDLASLGNN